MADSYETLESVYNRHFYGSAQAEEKKQAFYKALRRMYFANVATFLCQYHDGSPETGLDTLIDPFQELEGKNHYDYMPIEEAVNQFLQAWSALKYNLITNDGEMFVAKESYELLNNYASNLGSLLAEIMAKNLEDRRDEMKREYNVS